MSFAKDFIIFSSQQGEAYDDNEEGFRTWRNDDGTPARPEISAPTVEDATEKNDLMGKVKSHLQ